MEWAKTDMEVRDPAYPKTTQLLSNRPQVSPNKEHMPLLPDTLEGLGLCCVASRATLAGVCIVAYHFGPITIVWDYFLLVFGYLCVNMEACSVELLDFPGT